MVYLTFYVITVVFSDNSYIKIILYCSILLHLSLVLTIHCLRCNTTFHKTYHLYKFKSFLSVKIYYMFRPTWPSSGVKNMSTEEIAAFTCCWSICRSLWCVCVCGLWLVCYAPLCCVLRCMKHFKGFDRFTELHAKLDADTLLDFAIHCRQNETQSRKSTRVKTVRFHTVSLGRLIQ
jgi:hypothetical protein